MERIRIEPLTARDFAPFGDVIEIHAEGKSHPINSGTTRRFHDLARVETAGGDARPTISMARATPFTLPLAIEVVERHPLGSQAFIPVERTRFLVVVAPDEHGVPGRPRAFMAGPGQGISYRMGTWHGVLTALDKRTDFVIVDREGEGDNLEEYRYPAPFIVGE